MKDRQLSLFKYRHVRPGDARSCPEHFNFESIAEHRTQTYIYNEGIKG